MPRKRFTAEQIINKPRERVVELPRGMTVGQAVKRPGVTEQAYCQWRKEQGGLRTDRAKRLKELEKENTRREYNTAGPDSFLGYRLPAPEAILPWRSEAQYAIYAYGLT